MSLLNYHVHPDRKIIEVRPSGVVQVSDILSYAEEALSLDLITTGTVEYYDLSGMTNLSVDYKSARALAGTVQEWLARGWYGSVFVTPQEYQFGMTGAIAESIEGSPGGMMVPTREPIDLGDVRDLIVEHRRVSR